jgi:hypothetical protein
MTMKPYECKREMRRLFLQKRERLEGKLSTMLEETRISLSFFNIHKWLFLLSPLAPRLTYLHVSNPRA